VLLSKHEAAEKVPPLCWDRFIDALRSSLLLPGCRENDTLTGPQNGFFQPLSDKILSPIAALAGVVSWMAHALPISPAGYFENTEMADALLGEHPHWIARPLCSLRVQYRRRFTMKTHLKNALFAIPMVSLLGIAPVSFAHEDHTQYDSPRTRVQEYQDHRTEHRGLNAEHEAQHGDLNAEHREQHQDLREAHRSMHDIPMIARQHRRLHRQLDRAHRMGHNELNAEHRMGHDELSAEHRDYHDYNR
jgi:hypothetical protein